MFLSEIILPSSVSLKDFSFVFQESESTNNAYKSLTQSIAKIANNLTTLMLDINWKDADKSSLQKFFVSMPNLDSFGCQLGSQAFDDEVLNTFISNILPSLKKLKLFQLLIGDSAVTDLSVRKLFEDFPKESFLTLNDFHIDLAGTKITDESLRGFVDRILPNLKALKALKDLEIQTQNTQVTKDLENKLSEWRKSS